MKRGETMNKIQSRLRLLTAVLAGAAMLLLSGAGMADPPARVARLSFFSGPVSFSPAGEDEWVLATPNRPLITGDRLWADAGGRAELQAGSIALRLGASTNVNVLNLDDRTTQLELTQGSLYVRVWRIDRGDTVEIDTPNLAFTVDSVGRYRIDVDADGNVTTLAVLAGQGEAYGEGAGYRIGAGDRYSFSGTGLRDYEYSDVGAPDEFDRWAAERDRRYDTSVSARYVSRDVIGYQDLDQYGSWSVVADYGNVWYPRSMPSGWAPYRTGHWAWIDPWGWTWIDEALRPVSLRSLGVRDRPLGMDTGPGQRAADLCAGAGRLHRRWGSSPVAVGRRRGIGCCLVPARPRRGVPTSVSRQPRIFHQRQRQQHACHQRQHNECL
jgi:hypothetical protein